MLRASRARAAYIYTATKRRFEILHLAAIICDNLSVLSSRDGLLERVCKVLHMNHASNNINTAMKITEIMRI